MKLDYNAHTKKLEFYPDSIPADEVKMIGGRLNKKLGFYQFPPVRANYFALNRLYGEFPITEEAWFFLVYDYNYAGYPLVESIKANLYEYQKSAICFLVNNPLPGKMLSLAQGLGKTLVAIYAAKARGFKRILVICPLTLVQNWVDEYHRWTGEEATTVHGRSGEFSHFTVTNYDSVIDNLSTFEAGGWDLIICDESILLKNGDSNRSKRIKKLREKVSEIWLLSGSPVSRYADDLYSQFYIMNPHYFTSYWRFADAYCYVMKTNWGTEIIGSKRTIDYRREFSDIIFRVNKEEAQLEIPDMLFDTYSVKLTDKQQEVYNNLENDFFACLDDASISVPTRLASLIRLQQTVSNLANLGDDWPNESAKMNLLMDLAVNKEIDTPCIIWVNWIMSGHLLCSTLNEAGFKAAYVYGGLSAPDRQKIIQDFHDGKIKYLIMSIGVGKYGLTLTEAKTMIYFDKTFDGDGYVQSQDRIHRIGLKHKPTVISLVAKGTTDELIADNLINKAVSMAKISGSEMRALFESLRKEQNVR